MKNILTITIDNLDDCRCPYNPRKLNSDLMNYILDEARVFSFRKNTEIQVFSKSKLTIVEKNEFVDILRSSLGVDIKESYLEMKFICLRATLLAVIGFLSIMLYFWAIRDTFQVFSEILLIIGWIGIWEGGYIFLFDNVSSRMKIKKYKRLVKASITFHDV